MVSGLKIVTLPFTASSSSLAEMRRFAFAAASSFKELASPQPVTPSLVIQDERHDTDLPHWYNCLAANSFMQFHFFNAMPTYYRLVSSAFDPLLRVLFNFPFLY